MAWTAPMTAVDNTPWLSSDWNTYVRDNLLQTMPALATTAGAHFCVEGTNDIGQRVITSATVATSETRASTSYGDCATVGPAVTVTTGTSALVWVQSAMANSSNGQCLASVAVSGASTIAADDAYGIELQGVTANNSNRWGSSRKLDGLTAGSNTFTMKYAATNTGTFANRHLVVMPL